MRVHFTRSPACFSMVPQISTDRSSTTGLAFFGSAAAVAAGAFPCGGASSSSMFIGLLQKNPLDEFRFFGGSLFGRLGFRLGAGLAKIAAEMSGRIESENQHAGVGQCPGGGLGAK